MTETGKAYVADFLLKKKILAVMLILLASGLLFDLDKFADKKSEVLKAEKQ